MLSVVVCTRNRPALLGRCLKALLAQPGDFEVLVVDQGDRAAPLPADRRLRRLAHRERGLAAGRNAGGRAATGAVIAFLDDDAVPDPGYIKALERAFGQNPRLAAAAGRILALEDGRPYARVQDGTPRWLGQRDWLRFMGGNFAVRRAVLQEVGPFDERFGAGRPWASGEETDYFFRLLYRNCPVAYVPEAVVRHPREDIDRVPPELRRKLFGYARGQGALMARHLVDFANYRLLATLAWTVAKPGLRATQYALALQWRRAWLQGALAVGKCLGFAEFWRQAGGTGGKRATARGLAPGWRPPGGAVLK
jgi:glycosyltransferase involved in cell wall biosynthesis